ncbi:MAG: discoidin domain-containing protein [bacterium]
MKNYHLLKLFYLVFLIFFSFDNFRAQSFGLLDDFDSLTGWNINASDLVEVVPELTAGKEGNCIKINYDFKGGSGYGGIQKKFPIKLPANYIFSFYIKADSPDNTLEFKLIDKSGDNVWWVNNRNFNFPKEWTKLNFKKRNIVKAWGPLQLDKPEEIDKIEIIITSVNGGKGSVYIDILSLEEKEVPSTENKPPFLTSKSALNKNSLAYMAADNNIKTSWKSATSSSSELFQINFNKSKELGGLIVNWDTLNFPDCYKVFGSDDKTNWELLYTVKNGKGGIAFIPLKECETKHIKFEFDSKPAIPYYEIIELSIMPVEFSENGNKLFETIAKYYPQGYFPKYLNPQASYFTITGIPDDTKEALINEEGQVEVDKSSFSLQPSLYINNKYYSWSNIISSQTLEENYLPIPNVNWAGDCFNLQTKLFASGIKDSSITNVIYTLTNTSNSNVTGNMYISVIPFQVNPSYQFLNTTGGVSNIKTIEKKQNSIVVNNNKTIYIYPYDYDFGVTGFDGGYISDYISNNKMPASTSVFDEHGYASGVIQYQINLKPGEIKSFYVSIPFYNQNDFNYETAAKNYGEYYKNELNKTQLLWKNRLNNVTFKLPKTGNKIINTLRSTLAYILINKDNHGFQPGSRSYERSWIRDGSMTSSTLLKLGITDQVKDFITWYSLYQYPNGKIPCVVDTRGADSVPENDSHGQFIFAVYQYYLFTKDTSFLQAIFPKVVKTVDYIEFLIQQRSTADYKTKKDLIPYYGLVPESISHEGYSDKPMHSYWDDFYTLKGLKDAVEIAKILNNVTDLERITKLRDNFRTNLYKSIELSTKMHKIDYIPGCVEKGDFDATSTTISLYPCNERKNLPAKLLQNTFDKYYGYFTARRDDPNYKWDAYTPYEIRNAGAFLYLDQPERTHELLDYFFKDQRPQGWNEWAEVVWRDAKLPRFIGDMPHTWVGSDYITVARTIFVYENELDNSLILGAGLYKDWIDDPAGMEVNNLKTYYGSLNYSIKKQDNSYIFNISGNIEMPKGNIIIKNFNKSKTPKCVLVNGKKSNLFTNNSITVNQFPAKVVIEY